MQLFDMQSLPWFDRKFSFGLSPAMLPFMTERLEGTIVRLRNKTEGVDESVLAYNLDNKWSIKQNIGHLIDVDVISRKRVAEIVSRAPFLSRADIETQDDYNGMPIWVILDRFNAARRANIDCLLSLSEPELKMATIHPRLNVPMNAVDLAWFDAEHDDHHLVRISTILTTIRKSISRSRATYPGRRQAINNIDI